MAFETSMRFHSRGPGAASGSSSQKFARRPSVAAELEARIGIDPSHDLDNELYVRCGELIRREIPVRITQTRTRKKR
jgi:hypothetical protein